MKLLRITVCLAALSSSAVASIPVGRGEIALDAEAMVTYDSNVQGRQKSDDDVYGTFAPRISYTRRAGIIGADLSARLTSERYVDNKQFNADNVSANASLSLSEKSFQNISGSATASYVESYQIDQDINARIKTHAANFNGQFGYTTSPRTHFDAKANYSNTERAGTAASDQEFFDSGLDFGFSDFLDGTALHLTYDYTRATSSGNNARGAKIDQDAHLFSVGLSRPIYHDVTGRVNYGYRILNRSAAETATGATRETGSVFSATLEGPFLPPSRFPKIKSHLSLSYENATTPGVNDTGGSKQLTGDLGLTWSARETTSVSITASRSQRLSSNDLTAVTTATQLGIEQKLGYSLTGTVNAGYTWNTYRTIARSDEFLTAQGSLSYVLARDWSSSISYQYQKSTSDFTVATYERHVASLSLNYHY